MDDEVPTDDGQPAVGAVEADVAAAVGVQHRVPDDQALTGAEAGVVLGVRPGGGDGGGAAVGGGVGGGLGVPVVETRAAETQPMARAEARVGFMHVLLRVM